MYYLLILFLYPVSLLPLWVLYRLSDFAWLIMYHIVGYRKEIVMHNLEIAFPEKTIQERKQIARRFYLHLTDTFIETIKMISIPVKKLDKICEMDLSKVIELADKGVNIQFHAGHQFNWELANWMIAQKMPIPFIGIYKRIHNKAFDKIFFDMRSRTGGVLVGTHEYRNRMHQLMAKPYSIGLAADQNPVKPEQSYWLNFFQQPVSFITGPDKGAIRNKTAVVFVKLVCIERGKYRFETSIITENASQSTPGELTRTYRDLLEKTIREQPANYLWSHRRWRRPYQPEFEKYWIDTVPPPQS